MVEERKGRDQEDWVGVELDAFPPKVVEDWEREEGLAGMVEEDPKVGFDNEEEDPPSGGGLLPPPRGLEAFNVLDAGLGLAIAPPVAPPDANIHDFFFNPAE